MKILFGFFLLFIACLFWGITVEDSIIPNIILKGLGFLCIMGFVKTIPKDNNLY